MKKVKRKWFIAWFAFGILIVLFLVSAIIFEEKAWIGNLLQTIGTVAGIYLTLLIFFKSKEESDKQFHDQLNHLQNLTTKQIEALHSVTEKQIIASQVLMEKQIEALHKSTRDEITSFEIQTSQIAKKLSDNSVLIAELLSRELETALHANNNIIAHEQKTLSNLEGFTLLRTPEERENQLKGQNERLSQFKKYQVYLDFKYKQVKQFLKSINT